LSIEDENYEVEIFVVPTSAMTSEVILGRDFLRNIEVVIRGGRIRVKRLPVEKAATEKTEETIRSAEEDTGRFKELTVLHCSVVDELEVPVHYSNQIETMVKEYQPKRNVETPVETKIVLKDEIPVNQRPRRLAPREKKVLDDQISEWLQSGIIKPSRSEYASPVVIVRKKDGSSRVCIDYRSLNKKITRDRYPMPLIDDKIDALAKFRVFSVLDLKNGFFHVPVSKESQKYTAFVTPTGQYEFTRTPFGLCNSPTSFLRFISEVFRDLIQKSIVFTYMDDLIVPGSDEKDAFSKLTETLAVAASGGLEINWKKCKFLQKRVEFLGHVIEDGCVQPSPTKIEAVQSFPPPSTFKQLQSFLGLTGYFRKFIKDYAKIAYPLYDLKEGQQFYFGQSQQLAFTRLREVLSKNPVLRIYDPEAVTELHTDASKQGYGAALLQRKANEKYLHPVYYLSNKTTEAEKKWCSYELEILAIIKAIKKFRVYLLGIRFKIVTDCQAFQRTLFKENLPPKVARWALMLEEFDYEIEHRSSERMKHVDALSRFPVMLIEDTILMLIKNEQDAEERLQIIKQLLAKEPYEDYVLENGVLMKKIGAKSIVVLPSSMYHDIIRKVHENGHFGVKKMMEAIQEEYYIPRLKEKLEQYVGCCVPCVLAEKKKGKKEGMLRPIPKGDAPLSTYHMDHLGPMTSTAKLYKYLLVIVDGFSKFVWIYPTKSTNTKEVLDKLTAIQQIFGNPQRIITDKGAAFTSTSFNDYCTTENIEHVAITTGVPRGNEQAERVNRVIIPVLTKLSLDHPDRWYRNVPKLQRCINSTYQRSVGMSPFEALFGIKMKQQEDVQLLTVLEQEYVQLFNRERDNLRDVAKQNILKVQEENQRLYNKHRKKAPEYKEGELVAIRRTQFAPGLKIKTPYLGPYKISQVKGNDRYEMVKVGSGEGPLITTSAADYMKAYKYPSGTEGSTEMAECRNDDSSVGAVSASLAGEQREGGADSGDKWGVEQAKEE